MNHVTFFKSCVTLLEIKKVTFVICKSIDNLNHEKMKAIQNIGISWKEQKSKLKEKIVILTNNDLAFEDGIKEEVLGKLEITLGKTKEQLHAIIAAI